MPGTAAWSVVGRGLAAVAVLAAASLAAAAEVHSIEPGTDSVRGTSAPGDAPRLLPVRLFAGAPFSVEVKADKGSLFRPSVILYGADRKVDASAAFVLDARGVKSTLKNWVPSATGLHWIEVKGADGSSGAWTLKTKVKLPKGVAGAGSLGGETAEFVFASPGRAVASIAVVGAPKESGAPVFGSLRETGGPFVEPGTLKATPTGFSLKGAVLAKQGNHSLFIDPAPHGPGTFAVKVAWKVAPAAKRILAAADVIADPVLLGIDPAGGNQVQVVPVTLAVDFARPGAVVEFHTGSAVVTVPAGSITLGEGQASFSLALSNFGFGTYDVVLRNPDGGSSSLDGAFTVEAAVPVPVSVSPAYGYQGTTRRLRIAGTQFHGSAVYSLRKGAAVLPATPVGSGAGFVDVDVSLAGAALGAWDVAVANPGAAAVLLPGAFEVLEVITLASMSPADNRDGLVVDAVITGGGFPAGAGAVLVRDGPDGPEEIAGTSVQTVSATSITAVFDTTGAPASLWDLVLSFPTGEVRTLEGVFRTRIQGGGTDPVQPFSAKASADGPPALACNETTGESLAAWVEEDSSGIVLAWYVYAQLLDASGNPVGKPVQVSDDGGTMEKRYAAAGWDPVRDEFLVTWTEKATVAPTQVKGQTHPNGSSKIQLFQVMAQVLTSADLKKSGSNVRVTDATSYARSSPGTWYLGDFNAYRPSLAFDATAKTWEIAWMGEFDTSGQFFTDDYDVFQRSFDPATSALGSPLVVAATDAHEGDPALAWDGKNGRTILVFNARASSKGGDLDLWLGSGGAYVNLVAGNGDDLGDPRLAVDPDNAMAVVTWTRAAADGTRSAEAVGVALSDLSTIAGDVQVLGSGGVDMLVCPVVNRDLGTVPLLWTRGDGKGDYALLRRDGSLASGKGLELTGEETELSKGSDDGGLAAAVYAEVSGETTVLWLAKLAATNNPTYQGDVLPEGIVRGADFWFQRLR